MPDPSERREHEGRSASDDATIAADTPATGPASDDATIAADTRATSSASDDATIAADTPAPGTASRSRSRSAEKHGPVRPRLRGELVGRYILLNELGAGAMGVVWAAHDPELDRRVAVKLLVRGDQSERLLREAQALARLAHPNVVAVYDAGVSEGDVWLAMELVVGVTFKTWLKNHRSPPGWRAVLAALLPACQGVAAAHAAGLIHRDLKPDNLMIGDDGRARVMDFGLARAGEALGAAETAEIDGILSSRSSLLSSDVTRTGAILGTPAYMAPEQLRGRADERSDVFSLCVVLWEALHGARPFGGETVAATLLAISEGRIQAPPRGRDTPRWLRRALVRGLALKPADRWPGVQALIEALDRGRARSRRSRLLAGAALVAAGVGAAFGGSALARGQRIAACAAEGAAIEAVWPGRAEAVAAGLAGSSLAYAATTRDKLTPLLDAWARRWHDERNEACLAATVEGTLAPELRERAEFCLDTQRTRITRLLDDLAAGNKVALGQATPLASQMSIAPSCVDRKQLERGTWPPAEHWAAVREVRAALVGISALNVVGDHEKALAEARALRVQAEAVGWPPLLPEIDLTIGKTLTKRSQFADAEVALRAAYFGAGRSGADSIGEHAAIDLTLLVGHHLRRTAEGLEWGEHAAMLVTRLGEDDALKGGDLLSTLSSVRINTGELDKALELAERALEIRERILAPDHLDLARTIGAVGHVLRALGRNEEARARFERVLAIHEAALGPDHPDIAGDLNNLALAIQGTHDGDAAIALYERSVALSEANGEGETPAIAIALNNIMMQYADKHRFDEALAAGARALAIRERSLGPDHPLVAASLNNLGIVRLESGQPELALELHQRALALREAKLGLDHPEVARSLTNLGETQVRRGHPELALPLLARAKAIRTAKKVAPQDLAYTEFITASALAAIGQTAEARELASAAAEVFRRADDDRVTRVDALLASLAADPPRPTKKRRK